MPYCSSKETGILSCPSCPKRKRREIPRQFLRNQGLLLSILSEIYAPSHMRSILTYFGIVDSVLSQFSTQPTQFHYREFSFKAIVDQVGCNSFLSPKQSGLITQLPSMPLQDRSAADRHPVSHLIYWRMVGNCLHLQTLVHVPCRHLQTFETYCI